jgi:outer membrane protein assembly factor BamB
MSDEIRGPVPLSDRPPPASRPAPGPTVAAAPTRPPRRFRIRFPVTVLIVAALIFFWPVLWVLGWEAVGQEAPFVMWFGFLMFVVPLTVVVLAVWWLFFAAVSWKTRLLGFVLAAILLGAFIGSIRRVEMTMPTSNVIWPKFYMVWDQLPDQRRANFQMATVDKDVKLYLTVGPEDFARYRGPAADGVSAGPALETDWKAHPPKIVWQHPSGGGYSGFAVAGNIVVTLEQLPGKESLVCYDRATGRQRWAHTYDAYHKDVMGDGPRGTPLIADGFVYSLGAAGELVCLNGETGNKSWSVNVLDDCKAKKPQWGLAGSPLLVGDHIIVNAGVDPDHPAGMAVAAYDRKTGKRDWATGNRKAGYSSPQLATLAGKQQILVFDGEGLGGFDPADGKELWFHEWKTFAEMNDIQPLVIGDDVFISSEATNGCALVRVKPPQGDAGWTAETVWSNKGFAAKYANPVLHNGSIYGLSNGVLYCLDPATGEKRWKLLGRYGMGQLLLRGNTLVIMTDGGDVALVAADPKAGRELARLSVFDGKKTWNTPALAGDQLFLRNQMDMACVQLPVVKK